MLVNVDDKVAYFATITWLMVEKYFPLTPVSITNTDKEWVTPNIKKLIAQRQKAHRLKKYKLSNNLAKQIRVEIKKAKVRYNKRKKSNLLSSSSKEWYRHINNIIGNKKNGVNSTNIPELANKSPDEQVTIVNDHFANICRKYPSLEKEAKI